MATTTTGQDRRERLPILALLAATAVSLLGNQFTLIAIPWFVLQTTGSAARTGFTGFFGLLPLLIGGVFGGLLMSLILAAAPLGLLIAGFALNAIGLRATLLVMACAYTAVVIGTALNPVLRGLDGSRPEAGGDHRHPGSAVGAEPA